MNYSRSLTGTDRARARRPPCRRPGERALAHLFQLGAGGHLLGEQRGLDAVEQPLQPAHQLRLGDAQFGVRRRGVLVEGQGEAVEFLTQFRRQALFQFPDAGGVDLAQPVAAGVIQRRCAHFLEQLLDHGPDPHHLCRLLDQIGQERSSESSSVIAIIRGSTPPMISTSSSSLRVLKTSPSFVDYGCGVVPLGRHS